MKNSEINCERILLKEIEKSNMDQRNEYKQNMNLFNENTESNEMEREFDKLVNKVENEMGNLKTLKTDLMRFKQTRLRKDIKKQDLIEQPSFKENISSESKDEFNSNDVFNLLKSKSFSQKLKTNSYESDSSPKSSSIKEKSIISNDFQNFDFSSLQKLLSMNHSMAKIKENEKTEDLKPRAESNTNSEEILRNLLKSKNNSDLESISMNSNPSQKIKFGKNSKNSEITSMEEALKQLKLKSQTNDELATPAPKKKSKSIDLSGIPLGEIEKQIAMLKSISVKN